MGTDVRGVTARDSCTGHRPAVLTTLVLMMAVTATTVGCGPPRHDINDAFNTRDTGPYQVLSRQAHDDGTVVIHIVARKPEHAREIAEDIVVQNYAFSPHALRVIVDATGDGERHVYRWDAQGLRDDAPRAGDPSSRAGAQ